MVGEVVLKSLTLGTRSHQFTRSSNNTNPILNDDSPEVRIARDAGWEIAYDGMELVL